MLTKYTDQYVGSLARKAVDYVVPAIAATYTAGYIFGQLIHGLNNKLVEATR